MKFKKSIISILLITILCFTGCTKWNIPTNANTAFRNFTLCLFQEEVSANTINLHYILEEPTKYGIVDFPITFGSYDFNETVVLASIENIEAALHKFSPKSLSKSNQITYDILADYFQTLREGVPFHYYEEPLSPVTGIHAQLPVLLAEYQFHNSSDVKTYLALLKTMPEYINSLIRFEQQKSAKGLFMSNQIADKVILQCNAFIKMGNENYLLSTFEDRIDSLKSQNSDARTKLIETNREIVFSYVIPAYESLVNAITTLKGSGTNEQGLCYFPDGKEYYSYLVSSETGSSKNVSELKELIQGQIFIDLQDSQKLLLKNPTILEETDSITESPETILQTLKAKTKRLLQSTQQFYLFCT